METKENGPSKKVSNGGIDGPTNPMVTPLLNDLYQFTMAYAYWKAGKQQERAVSVFLVLFWLIDLGAYVPCAIFMKQSMLSSIIDLA